MYFLYSRLLLAIYFIHISVYMSIPVSPFIPPPPRHFPRLVSIRLFSASVSLFLPCQLGTSSLNPVSRIWNRGYTSGALGWQGLQWAQTALNQNDTVDLGPPPYWVASGLWWREALNCVPEQLSAIRTPKSWNQLTLSQYSGWESF